MSFINFADLYFGVEETSMQCVESIIIIKNYEYFILTLLASILLFALVVLLRGDKSHSWFCLGTACNFSIDNSSSSLTKFLYSLVCQRGLLNHWNNKCLSSLNFETDKANNQLYPVALPFFTVFRLKLEIALASGRQSRKATRGRGWNFALIALLPGTSDERAAKPIKADFTPSLVNFMPREERGSRFFMRENRKIAIKQWFYIAWK